MECSLSNSTVTYQCNTTSWSGTVTS